MKSAQALTVMNTHETDDHPSTPADPAPSQFSAYSLALKLGYMIALPAVLFTLLGRFADKASGTSPLFLIAGLLLSLIASSLAIFREIRKIRF